jgi:hypothetical protein
MKFKVQIAGTEHDVDIPNAIDVASDEFKQGYKPIAVHNHELAAARRSTEGLKKPEDLLSDDAFKAQALTTWGIDPKGKAKLSGEELAQLQEQIRTKEVKPLQDQLTKATATITSGRQSQLRSVIESHARALHVDDRFLASPHEGAPPMIVAMLEPLFGFDEETANWAVKKGEKFEYSSKPVDGQPWKGPIEFLAEWAGSDKGKGFLKDVRQRVAGPGGAQGAPAGSMKTIAGNDPLTFGQNLEGIAKGDVTVQT